jgi:hypothetical protein
MISLGLEISLPKSLLSSNGSFEMAKRFFWGGRDCSQVSVKLLTLASRDITSLEQLLFLKKRLTHFGKPVIVAKVRHRGYRVKGSISGPLKDLS